MVEVVAMVEGSCKWLISSVAMVDQLQWLRTVAMVEEPPSVRNVRAQKEGGLFYHILDVMVEGHCARYENN